MVPPLLESVVTQLAAHRQLTGHIQLTDMACELSGGRGPFASLHHHRPAGKRCPSPAAFTDIRPSYYWNFCRIHRGRGGRALSPVCSCFRFLAAHSAYKAASLPSLQLLRRLAGVHLNQFT